MRRLIGGGKHIKRLMMRCGRYHGLMVVDCWMDMEDDSGALWLRAWRCVSCGAVEESVITRQQLETGCKPRDVLRSQEKLLLERCVTHESSGCRSLTSNSAQTGVR